MSSEFERAFEQEPGNAEFSIVMGDLRRHFHEAVEEQQDLLDTPYRVFTVVDRGSGFEHDLARFRLVDTLTARDNLQDAAQEPGGYLDIALPITEPNPVSPSLVWGSEGDYFVVYTRDSEHREKVQLVNPYTIQSFLTENQDFLSRSLTSDVVPLRKT